MNGKNTEGQRIHRLPPCPAYDIAGMEGWLSDMAEQGWFLTQDGFFAGVATFEARPPQPVKYRLEAAQKNPSIWAEDGGEPDPEQIALGEAYSWQYVAKRGDFYIFRTLEPAARELNTDPAVQALALNAVKKRRRDSLLSTLLLLVIYPVLLTRGCPVLTAITFGTWWAGLVVLFVLLMLAGELRAFISLNGLQKSLMESGCAPAPARRRNGTAYNARRFMEIVLAVVLLCAFLQNWSADIVGENRVLLEDYSGTLPFASMRDFAGGEILSYTPFMTGTRMGLHTIAEKTDLLAPRCIDYRENAAITAAGGTRLEGGLHIQYFELRTPWLAEQLARELYRTDTRKKDFHPLTVPALSADFTAAYDDSLHFPTVLFRKGSTVVRAYFYQSTEYETLPLEEWAGILCDSITG